MMLQVEMVVMEHKTVLQEVHFIMLEVVEEHIGKLEEMVQVVKVVEQLLKDYLELQI